MIFGKEKTMAEPEVHKELTSLKTQLTDLRTDLGDMAQTLKRLGMNAAGLSSADIQSAAQRRLEEIKDAMKAARERGMQSVDGVRHEVERNPMASLLTAFGVGIVLGWVSSWGGSWGGRER